MTDLDTQVAEAQGWTARMMESGGWRWYDRYGKLAMGKSMYRPSTDLNQAVAFSEWFLSSQDTYCFIEMGTICYPSKAIGYEVEIYKQNSVGQYFEGSQVFAASHNLAEALCRAVLKALGETSI